ncbi:hypothetical protein P148_SR1C00001G0595 [candidate division SR1 bacterium RAAC1_SR1_1]|nr:hypothetical protein P148_SR1C00001G0595 [candidate division SR1 bacterium RAAC1_SR1_1]
MQLFKRLLLSLFPEQTANQGINPASMFISFISTKEFFSVINRKIVENYKLNLFDVTIDPFEFKTGFGENTQIKQKDIDLYYGYCASANINGYRFFNPANVGNNITLVTSLYTRDCFENEEQDFFLNFLYTTYLLFFVFSAKIKNFPYTSKEDNYNRFIEVFFSFYEFIFQQTGKKPDKATFARIKKNLLSKVEIFFFLFYSYQKYNKLFTSEQFPDEEFYKRLFSDELKNDQQIMIEDFAQNVQKYTSKTTFSAIDNKLLQYILPADILIRYLFLDTNMTLIIESVVAKLFNKETLDNFMKSFLKDDSQWDECILYITDYKHYKKNFFAGVQKYLITALKKEGIDPFDEDIEESGSRIGDDEESIENLKIPERIKKESKIMEKILNFFITLLGGFWIARGESLFLRLYKPNLLKELITTNYENLKETALHTYGGLLYSYGKNIFYYKYISENVRLGRQKFYLPTKSTSKNTYSNFHILRLMDESALAIILQDINPKDIKIYNKNKLLIELFKNHFGKEISNLVQLETTDFIKTIYQDIEHIFTNKNLTTILERNFNQTDLYHIKESLYNIDFRISKAYYQENKKQHENQSLFDGNTLLEIYAQHKETLLGFLLYLTRMIQKHPNDKEFFITLYNRNIIHIADQGIPIRNTIISNLFEKYKDILQEIITIDDNLDFLRIGEENLERFTKKVPIPDIQKQITGEDYLWFKGYLKNITYYNKRFFIPK